jgi:replicative DNA helicase
MDFKEIERERRIVVALLSRGYKPEFYSLLNEEMFKDYVDKKVIRALKQGFEFKNQDWGALRKVAGLKASETASLITDTSKYEGWIHEKDVKEFVREYRKQKAEELFSNGDLEGAIEYSRDTIVNSKSVYEDYLKHYEENRLGADRGLLGLSTGINLLDKVTSGFRPSKVWVVGGYNAFGKSFFMTNMINQVLDMGERVVVFTLEMKKEDILDRLIGERVDLGVYELSKTCNEEIVKKEMDRIKKHLEDKTLRIYDSTYDISDIVSQARVESANGHIGVLFLDFIQLVQDKKSSSNYEVISRVSTKMQELAKELNCCTMLLSQISNESQKGAAGGVYGFKGAGEIGQVADVAIKIVREKDEKGEFTEDFILDVVKNRTGRGGEIYCKITFPGGRITAGNPIVRVEEPEDEDREDTLHQMFDL